MTPPSWRGTLGDVLVTGIRAAHGPKNAARRAPFFVLFLVLATAAVARADVQSLDGMDAAVVRVNIRDGNVTVRTWDRPTVQIDADPSLQVIRRTMVQPDANFTLPIPYIQQPSTDGPVELPPENFVANVTPGAHPTVVVRDLPGSSPSGVATPVTITVPSNSAFVFARTGKGTLDVRDYRSGIFVGFVGRGRLQLTGVGGTVFTQALRGPTVVTDSSFERYRARSLFGDIVCTRCDAHQIEATSVDGSIVYDGGSFQPGLARFESTRGDVAVGTTTAAQLAGHAASSGRVFTSFSRGASIEGGGSDADVLVGGGGPVVNAVSASGNVFLYDGTLRSHPQLAPQWQSAQNALDRPGVARERMDGPAVKNDLFRRRFPDYRQSQPRRQPAQTRARPPPVRRRGTFWGYR